MSTGAKPSTAIAGGGPSPAVAGADDVAPEDVASLQKITSVYVYEAPVRLWHWINALAIVVLAVTGYFIGSPPPAAAPGNTFDTFWFGYIRYAHFAAGYVLAVGFLGRIYWAIVGNHHARQLFYVALWSKKWWKEVLFELRWYFFLEKRPKKYVGHNPLAQFAMFFLFTLGVTFQIVTGFALYGEGLGEGSWADTLFGWVIPLFGGSMDVHTWHHLGMWWIMMFILTHVYVAIREDIMSRQSIVSTMISGTRTFKDDLPD
ncbi:MAG: Ni/Fe-hydrogenase, b-type cytochrome subunit [Rhodospirillum sp.]|nr:Ni/Fe-hydrogenase, b-type cytochrome subunit [Rhodospirillum sp.]MCF8490990.1 Ni/Fe-hydrogenase, b-type cytochrome subunit [Rhodospirillum sp.]MCF8499491.1 Ni/Fe-hydrogenase, b-type cytochrome subunit [Rhodospirillum sp.]